MRTPDSPQPDSPAPDSLDRAKQACLKQSFGADLTADEQTLLDHFLASPAGQRYREESGEMQRLLGEVAEVEVTTPVDSAEMLRSFESMARNELRAAQRRVPIALLLTTGIGLLTGGICLQSGKEHLVFFGWTMLGFAPLCAILFVAIWNKQGAWLKDPDLLLRIEEEQEAGESKIAVIVWSVIGILLMTVLTVGVAKAGGLRAIGTSVVAIAVFSWICVIYQKRKRGRHQELWDWWYGRSSKS